MISLLCLWAASTIPQGAYSAPELCRMLTKATGTQHRVESALQDFPVFVSVKSGDPNRIEELTAEALHASWVKSGSDLILKWTRPLKDEGYDRFKQLVETSRTKEDWFHKIPVRDLYDLPPGNILRYGVNDSEWVKAIPESLAKAVGEASMPLKIRRMAPGVFELTSMRQVEFFDLPDEVAKQMGSSIETNPFKPTDLSALMKVMSDPGEMKKIWQVDSGKDPIALIQGTFLTPVANSISCDLVMVLPDFSLFALLEPTSGEPKIRGILSKYSVTINWKLFKGAAIGQVSESEYRNPTQCHRQVLRAFIAAEAKQGVSNIQSLSQYVLAQQSASSNCWLDVMMLALSGKVIDQEYLGDYPYNVRLYGKLDQDDWAKLRGNKSITANELSQPVKKELIDLLFHARSRMEDDHPRGDGDNGHTKDPSLWRTLDLSRIIVSPELSESTVLIGYTMLGGEVSNAHDAGLNYDHRRSHLNSEPTYQPAQKRTLKLKIGTGEPQELVVTGFSEVTPTTDKSVIWNQLPAPLKAEFNKGREEMRRSQPDQTKVPPP